MAGLVVLLDPHPGDPQAVEIGKAFAKAVLKRLVRRCRTEEVALVTPSDLAESDPTSKITLGSGEGHLSQLFAKLQDDNSYMLRQAPHKASGLRTAEFVQLASSLLPDGHTDGWRMLLITTANGDQEGPLETQADWGLEPSRVCPVHVACLGSDGERYRHFKELAVSTGGSARVVSQNSKEGKEGGKRKWQEQTGSMFFRTKPELPRATGSTRAQSREAPVPFKVAAAELTDLLSSAQAAVLVMGHLSQPICLRPPLLDTYCSPQSLPTSAPGNTGATSATSQLELSVLGFIPSASLQHPPVISRHLCYHTTEDSALAQLLTVSLTGDQRHEPLAAVVGMKGEHPGTSVERLGLLQCEPVESPHSGVVLFLSLFHPTLGPLNYLEAIKCTAPPKSTVGGVVEQVCHEVEKAQRYANTLPSREQALDDTVHKIKRFAATYNSPELIGALRASLEGIADDLLERAEAEGKAQRTHNTRRQARGEPISGVSAALTSIRSVLDGM